MGAGSDVKLVCTMGLSAHAAAAGTIAAPSTAAATPPLPPGRLRSETGNGDRRVLDVCIGGLYSCHGADGRRIAGGGVGDGVRARVVLRDVGGGVDHGVVRDREAAGLLVQIDAVIAVVGPLAGVVVVQVVVLNLRGRLLVRQRVDRRAVRHDLRDVVNVVVVDQVVAHRVHVAGPAVADRDAGVVRVRDLVVFDVQLPGIAGRDGGAALELGGHVVDVVVLDGVAGADLVLVGRVVGDVVLGGVAGGELANRDVVVGEVGDDVSDEKVVDSPRDEVQRGGAHLREDVSLEVDVVGVHHTDAGGRVAHRLLVVGGRRQVVLAGLRVQESRLAGTQIGRVRERDPLEPEIAGLIGGAGAGDADHRLDHRRDHHRLAHVLARAGLVGQDVRGLVEVPLSRLVQKLQRVLEVVSGLRDAAALPAQVRKRTRVVDGALGALELEGGGAARGGRRGQTDGAVPPPGHDVHLDLGEVVPVPHLGGGDLDVLRGGVRARQAVEGEGAVRPKVG